MADWKFGRIAELGVWSRGGGDQKLVLLHGGPGVSDYLEGLGDLLWEELGEDWTVVRYQQRGLAPSTLDGPFTMEQAVADVLAISAAFEGSGSWLLGHSWGGHLAMHAAVTDPERWRGLVIMDTLGAVPDGGAGAMFEHFAARLTSDEIAEWMRIEALSAAEGLTCELRAARQSILWPYYFSDPEAAPPMPPMSVGPGHCLSEAIAEHFEKQTLVNGLPKITTPALFVASEKGPIPAAESERSAALVPGAELVALPVGHFAWLESPASAVEPIAAFLSRT